MNFLNIEFQFKFNNNQKCNRDFFKARKKSKFHIFYSFDDIKLNLNIILNGHLFLEPFWKHTLSIVIIVESMIIINPLSNLSIVMSSKKAKYMDSIGNGLLSDTQKYKGKS